ncbi:MAG: hypothetical protein U5S82_17200 [Gammaproteobacteria bacterium]|nr:hypothetical protein [Gammaproteobacteria bacterium]
MSIAEAEVGVHGATFEGVDVSGLTENVAELYAAAAEERELQFR